MPTTRTRRRRKVGGSEESINDEIFGDNYDQSQPMDYEETKKNENNNR